MKKIYSIFLFLILAIGCISYQPSLANAETADSAYRSVYRCIGRVIYSYAYKDICGEIVTGGGQGSGVLVYLHGENKIITCYHVPGQKPIGKITVFFNNGDETYSPEVEIEKHYPEYDIAILKINGSGIPWQGVFLADNLKWGSRVYFGGYSALPLPKVRIGFLTFHMKYGIYLAPIYFGDSGGGVFDEKGALIGIIYLTYVKNSVPLLVGYARPVMELLR